MDSFCACASVAARTRPDSTTAYRAKRANESLLRSRVHEQAPLRPGFSCRLTVVDSRTCRPASHQRPAEVNVGTEPALCSERRISHSEQQPYASSATGDDLDDLLSV